MSTTAPPPTGSETPITAQQPQSGPPDLTQRNKLKKKYTKIQRKYFRTQTVGRIRCRVGHGWDSSFRSQPTADQLVNKCEAEHNTLSHSQLAKDLKLEADEKEAKVQRLQDEIKSVPPAQMACEGWRSWSPGRFGTAQSLGHSASSTFAQADSSSCSQPPD